MFSMTKVMTSLPTSLLIFLAIEQMVMDPTQFRERFKAWKDGKKPYKDGLPAYGDGKQTKKKWKYTPSDTVRSHIAKWEDSDFAEQNKQFGGDAVGAKAIEFANAIGEDIGRRLTSKELDGIFSTFYNLSPKTFNEKILPSIKKYAMDPNVLNRNELVDTMSNRYTLAAQKYQKGIKRRAAADTALTGLTRVEPQILEYKTKDGNKVMKFDYDQQFQPQPMPKPIPETQYPLSGSQAPESLSSWNAAQSPSTAPTIPSIQKLNNERQKAVQGAFQLPEVTVYGQRRMPTLLPKMPSLNDALMAYSPQNQMNRAMSEMMGLDDLWEDFDVTSDLFKAKDGKLPRYNTGLVPGQTEERSDNTRVERPEVHLPVKRQLLKKLVTTEQMQQATRNKPVISTDQESKHGAPKPETFVGEMTRVAGGDFVKADRASSAVQMADPTGIASTALGAMDLGMDLNRSMHELNDADQHSSTALSTIAVLPFLREFKGLKTIKPKDWAGKLREWYEQRMSKANSPAEVNKALRLGRYADAADDAHVPQIVLGSPVDGNPFKSPIDKSSLELFNDMKRLQIREALSQTGRGVSSGIDIAKDPYSLRNLSRDVVHHEGMPDEVEDIFRYQILPRTNINPLNYDNTIDALKIHGYNTLDDYNWNKYVDEHLGGYLDERTLAIAMPDGYIRKAAPHEFRHRMQHLVKDKPSLSIDRKAYLDRAYDDDFVNLPNTVDEGDHLRGYQHMEKEKATTNLDARSYAFENFTDNSDIGKLSVKEQNAFLDSLSDDQIIEAVAKANGYGRRYIDFLERKYDLLNNPKQNALWANKFRNAMKYYGSAAIPTAIVYNNITE